MSLSLFQDRFVQALFADDADAFDLARQPGFSVYRNTVMKGCIDALQANYPAVARLVGDEWFRAAAAVYVRLHAPQDPRLLLYGAGFADFLERFEPALTLPYLSGMARLDRFWSEAHAASDETALEAAALSSLTPQDFGSIALDPLASARWMWSESLPVYTIWQNNRSESDGGDIEWHGEGALLLRPQHAVAWMPLDAAGCAFLDACKAGHALADAAAAALAARPDTDLADLLATLLNAGAFSRMHRLDHTSFAKDES